MTSTSSAVLPDEMTPLESGALRRDWRLFTALTFLFGFGFSVYSGVFQNFLKDSLHADALMLGQIESLREIPGLLAALLAGLITVIPFVPGVIGRRYAAVNITIAMPTTANIVNE